MESKKEQGKQVLVAMGVLSILKSKRVDVKCSLKDVTTLISCYENKEYEPMFKTELYVQHGGEYCELLEILNLYLGH